jgi:hypothetical protein
MDILVTCKNCGTENTVTIAKGDRATPRCLSCKDILMRYVSVGGYIYILSNPAMKGLLKIGFSTRSVQERIAELNSATGVPMPFQIEASFVSDDPEAHEQQIHSQLAEYRVKGKEFFDVPLSKALKVIESVCKKRPVYSSSPNHCAPGWKSEYDD